jgi:Domain of unknown function (DUF4175)
MSKLFPKGTPISVEMKRRIGRVRWHHYRERMLFGLEVTAAGCLATAVVFSIIEELFTFATTGRTILFILGGILTLGCAAVLIVRPFLQSRGYLSSLREKEIAERIGKKFPTIKDRLRNSLEIFEEQKNQNETDSFTAPHYSPVLIEESLRDLSGAAEGLEFTEIVSFGKVKHFGKILSVCVVAIALLFVVPQSGLGSALYRIVHFKTDFHTPSPFSFHITPGNVKVIKDDPVSIVVSLERNETEAAAGIRQSLPQTISLSVRETEEIQPETIIIRADSSGRFDYMIPSLKQSVEYFAEASGVQSAKYSLSVTERPVVRSMRVHLTPPSYTNLLPQYLDENIGDISDLPGTIVRWEIRPTKKIKAGKIEIKDSASANTMKVIPLSTRDSSLYASMILKHGGMYHISLEDTEGITNANPIEYKVAITPDEYPRVEITDPGKNVDITPAMDLPMQLKLHDDFGFSSLRIAYRLVQSKYEKPAERYSYATVPLPQAHIAGPTTQAQPYDETVGYDWNLSGMGLVPEDVIEYRAEVFDNDNVSGPKIGTSQTYLLRLPSIQEVFADADKGHAEAIQEMEQSENEAEDLKKDIDEISRDIKTDQKFDWQKQQKTQELAKKYEDLQKKMAEVKNKVDTVAKELEKNNVLSPETLEKYAELQKMMQDMNSPDFQEALKRMQEAMKDVNPEAMLQAMQQVQFSEEMFRKSIERTLSLLKRIQIEEKMDEMVKRANQLQQQEDTLQKETAKVSPDDKQKGDELSQRQNDINKELQELQHQLSELHNSMEQLPNEMPMSSLEKSEQAANDQNLQQSLQQSSQQLSAQQFQQALQSQQDASKGMQRLSQSLSETQEQLLTNEAQETMNALRKTTDDLLDLSQREEKLKDESKNDVNPNSPQFRQNAEEQADIQTDLSNVANNLMDLSQKSFVVTPDMGKAIGQAMNSMNQALNGSEQRNWPMISSQQEEAMTSLNKAASLTQESLQAMQQAGSGGGMESLMQQLQRLSMQQQGINIHTEQLGPNQGMTQEQMQEIGRLASEQDAVRKSLEQLNKEAQESQQRDRILGNLQKIADEMKEVVTNMKQNDINQNTVHQQERILSRLLDAQNSIRERDYEQRRTSTPGVTPSRPSPVTLQTTDKSEQIQRDLLKTLEEGYSKDYQDLIQKYFEALSKKE